MAPPPTITTSLATEEDAPRLAAIMTAAFAASDAVYPLIWGSAPEGTHDMISIKGLFTPVQQEERITFKAVDAHEKIVGFATWTLSKRKVAEKEAGERKSGGHGTGLPPLPGVNMELFGEKLNGLRHFANRDVDPSKDMYLSFFFVHPDSQRQGIGSLLLSWGIEKADVLQAKIWIAATPQAVMTYERNGWKVIERQEISLEKYGGQGIYNRAWLLREPRTGV